ncbi:hypothetical protein BSP36_113 [Bacillus phage BSP36]|uniref:Phage protein n=1 Tax=Bacillus phage BSP38 TaxID=2283013 RepID=A0A345MJX6_BPBSP|nr:hypothetical protein HWB82_gp202 [Bacillus phage BSP38]AXH71158.1 hypothetical protein BSP38_116 [Bacillus phage BSP38]AYJ75200.1 hypothetical protein BSP36_113 [Bacillus phage BSP36]
MSKYRKKPVEVEAFLFNVDPYPDWFSEKVESRNIVVGYEGDSAFCLIPTLEGQMYGSAGDYIIRGIQGEIYPCKADIFEATYEKVE